MTRAERIERARLDDLRERYARDELGEFPRSLVRLELHIEQVLTGHQPTWGGLPFSPDPELRSYPVYDRQHALAAGDGMGFVTAMGLDR